MNTNLPYKQRRQQILEAAVRIAERLGYMNVNREETRKEAGVSGALVQLHFRTRKILKEAVFEEAIRIENLRILAQAVFIKSPRVQILTPELKTKISAYIRKEIE